MLFEFSDLLRKEDPGAALRDLDDVVVLVPVTTDDSDTTPAGSEGTHVGVWKGGEAFFVEFPEPAGALAPVRPIDLRRIGRHAL